jgi:hypothetical protein
MFAQVLAPPLCVDASAGALGNIEKRRPAETAPFRHSTFWVCTHWLWPGGYMPKTGMYMFANFRAPRDSAQRPGAVVAGVVVALAAQVALASMAVACVANLVAHPCHEASSCCMQCRPGLQQL